VNASLEFRLDMRARSQERRRVGRPSNGDTKSCPRCGATGCEFSERYRFDGRVIPAWVCGAARCRHRESVRREDATGLASSSVVTKSTARPKKPRLKKH
jgi:hypothetical protein